MDSAPVPFEIVQGNGVRVASDGVIRLTVFDDEGATLLKRRAVSVKAGSPPGESALPRLNALATEVLANPAMGGDEVAKRLRELADSIDTKPQIKPKAEWVYAKLDNVYVYVSREGVLVTRRDMTP